MSAANRKAEPKRNGSRVETSLKVVLGACVSIVVLGFLFPSPPQPEGEEILRKGVVALQEERFFDAEGLFRTAAQEGDREVANAAYHNLALLSLLEALKRSGPESHPATREAIQFSESAIALTPGTKPTAWNLELALRLLQAGDPGHTPQADQGPEQQESQAAADTRNEGLHDREADRAKEVPRKGEFSEDEARRLLASFRLMERENSREALKALLQAEPGVTSFHRRGPPW